MLSLLSYKTLLDTKSRLQSTGPAIVLEVDLDTQSLLVSRHSLVSLTTSQWALMKLTSSDSIDAMLAVKMILATMALAAASTVSPSLHGQSVPIPGIANLDDNTALLMPPSLATSAIPTAPAMPPSMPTIDVYVKPGPVTLQGFCCLANGIPVLCPIENCQKAGTTYTPHRHEYSATTLPGTLSTIIR